MKCCNCFNIKTSPEHLLLYILLPSVILCVFSDSFFYFFKSFLDLFVVSLSDIKVYLFFLYFFITLIVFSLPCEKWRRGHLSILCVLTLLLCYSIHAFYYFRITFDLDLPFTRVVYFSGDGLTSSELLHSHHGKLLLNMLTWLAQIGYIHPRIDAGGGFGIQSIGTLELLWIFLYCSLWLLVPASLRGVRQLELKLVGFFCGYSVLFGAINGGLLDQQISIQFFIFLVITLLAKKRTQWIFVTIATGIVAIFSAHLTIIYSLDGIRLPKMLYLIQVSFVLGIIFLLGRFRHRTIWFICLLLAFLVYLRDPSFEGVVPAPTSVVIPGERNFLLPGDRGYILRREKNYNQFSEINTTTIGKIGHWELVEFVSEHMTSEYELKKIGFTPGRSNLRVHGFECDYEQDRAYYARFKSSGDNTRLNLVGNHSSTLGKLSISSLGRDSFEMILKTSQCLPNIERVAVTWLTELGVERGVLYEITFLEKNKYLSELFMEYREEHVDTEG